MDNYASNFTVLKQMYFKELTIVFTNFKGLATFYFNFEGLTIGLLKLKVLTCAPFKFRKDDNCRYLLLKH